MAKIIVIEDDENLLAHITVVLQMKNHEVICYPDAPSAKNVLEISPDLVIIDIFLPNGNGIILSEEIKLLDPSFKIILTSADQHSLHFLGEVVANAVLPKPFSGKELLQIVDNTLENNYESYLRN